MKSGRTFEISSISLAKELGQGLRVQGLAGRDERPLGRDRGENRKKKKRPNRKRGGGEILFESDFRWKQVRRGEHA